MRTSTGTSGIGSVNSTRCRRVEAAAVPLRMGGPSSGRHACHHAVTAHAALRRATSCGLSSSSSSSRGTSTVACRAGGSSVDKQLVQDKQLAQETGTGPAPAADMQRKKGCCYGCGTRLQIEMPFGAGYVEPEKYATKKAHRQLDKVLCERCAELCNGAMIPGVMDFNQRLAEQRALAEAEVGLAGRPIASYPEPN
jgi:hypothetical protein